MKWYWLLHNVPDEDVRLAFAAYGKVTEITKQRWRLQGVADKGSTTRMGSLKLKTAMNIEDISYHLRVAGDNVLVVVAGRAPLGRRGHSMGHVRRECRVPKCTVCHRFGHTESTCVRTVRINLKVIAGAPTNLADSAFPWHFLAFATARLY